MSNILKNYLFLCCHRNRKATSQRKTWKQTTPAVFWTLVGFGSHCSSTNLLPDTPRNANKQSNAPKIRHRPVPSVKKF